MDYGKLIMRRGADVGKGKVIYRSSSCLTALMAKKLP